MVQIIMPDQLSKQYPYLFFYYKICKNKDIETSLHNKRATLDTDVQSSIPQT